MSFSEDGWPCQRLRLGIGTWLFLVFELTIGKKLPLLLVLMLPTIGTFCFISAYFALKDFKLKSQIGSIRDAIEEARSLGSL